MIINIVYLFISTRAVHAKYSCIVCSAEPPAALGSKRPWQQEG